MKTPKEKYIEDPHYHNLVNTMVGYMEEARFSPSELMQAIILAFDLFEKSFDNMRKERMEEIKWEKKSLKKPETLGEAMKL